MKILVAFATKYGSTRTIAEGIAGRLRSAGHDAQAEQVTIVSDLSEYEAFVVGSAAYIGHWLKEATDFVRQNAATLADRPTWLFSSGPLGTERIDAEGHDLVAAAEPREIAALREMILARGHHVFFGALDPARLGLRDRAIRALPAGRALLPEGDFRDVAEIDAWADSISRQLASDRVMETV
jgi:menaquinone-dependent protoporphyrinogen oxidase